MGLRGTGSAREREACEACRACHAFQSNANVLPSKGAEDTKKRLRFFRREMRPLRPAALPLERERTVSQCLAHRQLQHRAANSEVHIPFPLWYCGRTGDPILHSEENLGFDVTIIDIFKTTSRREKFPDTKIKNFIPASLLFLSTFLSEFRFPT